MSILIILTFGSSLTLLGKVIFRNWYNHVSLYSFIWTVSLVFFELRLINYYPLEMETWFVIIIGWISFVCGAIIVSISRSIIPKSPSATTLVSLPDQTIKDEKEIILLNRILWILIILTSIAALHTWYVLINMFGSLPNVILRASFLYNIRVSEGIKGTIPYLQFLCLSATLFAGVYAARIGQIKLVSVLPLIICIIIDIASMGRAMMIMAIFIFFTGYFLTPRISRRNKKSLMIQQLKIALVAITLLIAGSEFVRSTRHVNENIEGAKKSLNQFKGASFITPTIYMYISVHHGVLNQYLKHNDEKSFFAAHVFAPAFRLLSKLGFDTDVEDYMPFYRTPVGANTGTYLREVHNDFGIVGLAIFPFLLGMAISIVWYKYLNSRKYIYLALLGYMQVITAMSIFYLATIAGYLFVYLVGAIIIGWYLDTALDKTTSRT